MKLKLELLFIIAFLLNVFNTNGQKVKWIRSTEQNQWVQQEPITITSKKNSVSFEAEIKTDQKQQIIDGWGGCFNELGWDALQSLDEKERNVVLKEFFDPNEGLKYNICRMPIGANDYARNWYSLDDSVNDFDMKYFSIQRDKSGLIPYIKAAMKYRPDLKIWASPWSPPIWMKTNKHYANKPGDHNDLTWANAVKSGDQFIQQKNYLSAYAVYFTKFINSYQKEGVNVYAIHFQNEPYTFNQWPNCSWSAAGMRNFVENYLGPAFEKENIKSQIWFSTINNGNIAVFDSVLSYPGSQKYISGVGFQYEGKAAVAEIYRKYPKLKRMQTETECGDGSFDWKSAEHTFDVMKCYLDSGVNAYMYWNMILDETGTSSWGWKQNAQVTINKSSKKVTYTPEFYLFKHFSYFVTPGSVKVKAEGNFKDILAFITPEGKIIIIAANTTESLKSLVIKIGEKFINVTLPAKSFNTFIL